MKVRLPISCGLNFKFAFPCFGALACRAADARLCASCVRKAAPLRTATVCAAHRLCLTYFLTAQHTLAASQPPL